MRKIKYFIFTLFCVMSMMTSVYAASLSTKVTSTTVTVGNSVTVTLTFSSKKPIFFIEGTLKCSGAGVSGSLPLTYDNTSNDVYSKSFTYKVKPTKTGKVTCTTSGTKMIDASSSNWQSIDGKTINITVNEKVVVPPKVYSSNNYLSSLSISNEDLDKKFDKEVLEYSATLEPDTEKIKINAQLADSSASVSGTGEKSVSTGLNTFEVVVTAENGSKKTYVLKVTVKEHDPIIVTVDGKKYTVVRKQKDLPEISEYFEENELTILDNKVAGYYNKKLDYQLVGLKNDDGVVRYYLYNDDSYKLYQEYTFNGMVLNLTEKEVEGAVKPKNFEYNDSLIKAYQNIKLDIVKNTYALDNNEIAGNQYYLFYAINLDTGKEELYQYDKKEDTVQRYNEDLVEMYKEQADTYYLLLLCSILLLGVVIIIFTIIIIVITKKKKKEKARKIVEIDNKKGKKKKHERD